MSISHPTPPLLLTKRLTAFLHANQTPQLPTLLLTTPHGKLLAHASPSPVSLLRTHATVAASLLAIHTSSSASLPLALPGARTPEHFASSPTTTADDEDVDEEEDDRRQRRARMIKPVTITVQLSGGTVIIRRLKCGLLFVCVGPAAAAGDAAEHHDHRHGDTSLVGSPSEADSMMSAGGQTTTSLESAGAVAVVHMRRHAADLARWLDDRLGTLTVPEEGVGVE